MLSKAIFLLRFFAFCVLLFASFYFSQNKFFKIKNISCQTQYGPCSQKDEELIASFLDKNFFLLPNARVENTLLQNTTNNKAFIQKVFPDTLKINIEKRKPLVSIAQEEFLDRGVFLLDKDGVVTEFVKNSSLPILIIPRDGNLEVGIKIEEETRKAAVALSLLNTSQRVTKAQFQNKFLSFDLLEGINISFPLDRDPDVLIGALQLIITRSRIEGSLPKSIDLRYSKPVLKY